MILRYRLSLPNIKGFARVYEVKDSSTLYSFHKQMRADMDLPQDQIILFKAFAPDGSVSARYSVRDMGAGTIDSVTLGACHKKGEDSFTYFYDTTNVRSVIVTFEGEGEFDPTAIYPLLVETKGPSPIEFANGYVAFEDLPEDKKKLPADDEDDEVLDDEDISEEEEEDDDEDGKEIYDEDE